MERAKGRAALMSRGTFCYGRHGMKIAVLLLPELIGVGLCALTLTACGHENGQSGAVVSDGGASGSGTGGRAGNGSSGDAGAGGDAGSAGADEGGGDAGDPGIGVPSTPYAVFQSQLQVDVGCGMDMPDAALLIKNQGAVPLVIQSASADAGYTLGATFPLSIASGASVALPVSAPAPAAGANAGDMSSGTLTFKTNEPGSPSHKVKLDTTLFGAKLSFADSDGAPLTSIDLSYVSSSLCPDSFTYRVQNTGNVAFTLIGPTFPAHFGGLDTGPNGVSVSPGNFTELKVRGISGDDHACAASGELAFTATGAFCGTLPKVSVTWPTNGEPSCTCPVPIPAP